MRPLHPAKCSAANFEAKKSFPSARINSCARLKAADAIFNAEELPIRHLLGLIPVPGSSPTRKHRGQRASHQTSARVHSCASISAALHLAGSRIQGNATFASGKVQRRSAVLCTPDQTMLARGSKRLREEARKKEDHRQETVAEVVEWMRG
eukprot:g33402.t1